MVAIACYVIPAENSFQAGPLSIAVRGGRPEVFACELEQFVRFDWLAGQFLVNGLENVTILFRWGHGSFSMDSFEEGRRM